MSESGQLLERRELFSSEVGVFGISDAQTLQVLHVANLLEYADHHGSERILIGSSGTNKK